MALLFLEGFEGYAGVGDRILANTGPCRWMYSNHTNVPAFNTTTYRTTQVTPANSRSYQLNSEWSGMDMITVPSSSELIVGFGFYRVFNGVNVNAGIIGFCATDAGQGIVLGHNHNTGTLYAATPGAWGHPGANLGTASIALSTNQWYYIEVRAKFGTTTGEFEVWVDGVQVLNLSGINTAAGGIASYTAVSLACHNNGNSQWVNMLYDDLYICDKTGTTNNSFLGPISVFSLMPASVGSVTNLTATGAATNWQCVNDATNNNATSYVSTGVTGQKDYYVFQALPGGVTTVAGVMLRTCSTLGNSGTRRLKMNMQYAANVFSSALKILTLGSWKQDYLVADLAPDGTAWTPAKVNSTEAGVEAG